MWRLNYTHTSYTMENPFFAETSQNTQDVIQIAAIQKFRPTSVIGLTQLSNIG